MTQTLPRQQARPLELKDAAFVFLTLTRDGWLLGVTDTPENKQLQKEHQVDKVQTHSKSLLKAHLQRERDKILAGGGVPALLPMGDPADKPATAPVVGGKTTIQGGAERQANRQTSLTADDGVFLIDAYRVQVDGIHEEVEVCRVFTDEVLLQRW